MSWPVTRTRDPAFRNASFQNKPDAKLLRDPLHLYRFAFVSEGRVASDDEEAGDIRKVGNDILSDAITEVFLFRCRRSCC